MTKREKSEIFPTLKVEPKKEELKDGTALKFDKDMQITINQIRDIDTKHGTKTVAVVTTEDNKNFNVFVNQTSMNNLIDAFGEDDVNFIGKLATLKKEVDKHYNNDMIVFYPIK